MEFKYQIYLETLSVECPPSEFSSQERLAYRFVFESGEPNAKNNFLSVLIINPKRILNPNTPMVQCQGYALSLFDNQDNAEKRYRQLTRKRKALRKILVYMNLQKII